MFNVYHYAVHCGRSGIWVDDSKIIFYKNQNCGLGGDFLKFVLAFFTVQWHHGVNARGLRSLEWCLHR